MQNLEYPIRNASSKCSGRGLALLRRSRTCRRALPGRALAAKLSKSGGHLNNSMRVGASQITRIFPPWEESGRRAGRAGRAASLSLEDDEEERGEEGMKPHMYKNPKRRFFFLFFFTGVKGGRCGPYKTVLMWSALSSAVAICLTSTWPPERCPSLRSSIRLWSFWGRSFSTMSCFGRGWCS